MDWYWESNINNIFVNMELNGCYLEKKSDPSHTGTDRILREKRWILHQTTIIIVSTIPIKCLVNKKKSIHFSSK